MGLNCVSTSVATSDTDLLVYEVFTQMVSQFNNGMLVTNVFDFLSGRR